MSVQVFSGILWGSVWEQWALPGMQGVRGHTLPLKTMKGLGPHSVIHYYYYYYHQIILKNSPWGFLKLPSWVFTAPSSSFPLLLLLSLSFPLLWCLVSLQLSFSFPVGRNQGTAVLAAHSVQVRLRSVLSQQVLEVKPLCVTWIGPSCLQTLYSVWLTR